MARITLVVQARSRSSAESPWLIGLKTMFLRRALITFGCSFDVAPGCCFGAASGCCFGAALADGGDATELVRDATGLVPKVEVPLSTVMEPTSAELHAATWMRPFSSARLEPSKKAS